MKKYRKLVSVLLLLAMCVGLLAGCGQSTSTDNPSGGNGSAADDTGVRQVTIGAASDIDSFNPYANIYPERFSILNMVYQPLMLNVDNVFYNVLITGYDQLDTYTFELHLREGVYDTAGNPFTASDVLFSFGLAQESGFFSKLDDTESITAEDDYTVVIKFKDTMLYGEIDLLLTQVFMVTEAAYTASSSGMATDPVGTAGYVVDEYVEGSYIIFKAVENWWGVTDKDDPDYLPYYDNTNVDVVRYDFITEASSRAIALESGSIDIANKVDFIDWEKYESDDSISTYWCVGEEYTATYNCAEGHPLNNINLRLALSYCLDIDGVINGGFDGQAEPNKSMNTIYKLDCDPKYGEESYEYYDYNVDTAKAYLDKYLAETGQSASDVTITILVMNLQELEKVAEIWQTYILALGLKCEIASYDSVTRKTIRNSTDGWDIAVAKSTAVDLYNVDTLNMQWNMETGKAKAGGWVEDPVLHELMKTATSPETHSVETMSAFNDYMYEMCYARSVIIDRVFSASSSWIEKVDGPYDYTSPCACVYNWSAK